MECSARRLTTLRALKMEIPANLASYPSLQHSPLSSVGGKLISMYYALGEGDVYIVCECPTVTAAALSLAASSSGPIRTKTTSLLTVGFLITPEEIANEKQNSESR